MILERDPNCITDDVVPRILPAGWSDVPALPDMRAFEHRVIGLRVIFSATTEQDGKRWVHASVSRTDRRLPTWENLRLVKNVFIGTNKLVIQVLPREADYINIHPSCLHLWHCLDGDPTPDFTRGTGSI